MTFSWSEIGSGFGEPGGTLSSRIPRTAPPARQKINRVYNVSPKWQILYNEALGRANDIIRPRKDKIWKVPPITPYVLSLYVIIRYTYIVFSKQKKRPL